ncbi:hypothetical protein AB1Y20_015519 [Prymnesium parvum]|uniref:Isochorismatase-like domain-containing protein n=1 Tax=Prymnesium parvum TaxID=97485 RepID=A0AB34K0S0_PRYPA
MSALSWLLLCAASTAWAQCPNGWKPELCLGSSNVVASGAAGVEYQPDTIKWEAGLSSHSHYKLDTAKTALFVIDPQQAYSRCPQNLTVEALTLSPSADSFAGHSPLCCEQFDSAVSNQNRLARAARSKGMPVFVHAHVYRDSDQDGKVDNCGRLCDYDALGWTGWPAVWNLWNAALPWHAPVFAPADSNGFEADPNQDFYCEKSVFSAMTEPVVSKLRGLGIDTIIVTGFMTQYCSVTTTRAAHDLGFRTLFVTDANDGPILQQLLTGVDENLILPFYLGIAVADVLSTEEVLKSINGEHDEL